MHHNLVPKNVKQMKPWISAVVLAAFLGSLSYAGYRFMAPVPGQVLHVRSQSPSVLIQRTGVANPVRSVPLSVEVAGRLMKHYVPDGAQVEAGQILATLDWHEEEQHYRTLRATLAALEDQENHAEEEQVVLAQKKAHLTQQLDVLAKRIAQKSLIAPFSGQISTWQTPELAYVVPEKPLVVLRDLSTWQVSYSVPEHEAAYVQEGDGVHVLHEGVRFEAQVSYVAPEIQNDHTVLVRAQLDQAPSWRPGVAVEVAHRLALEEGIWLPEEVIEHDAQGPYVYRLVSGRSQKTYISTDHRVGSQAHITQGVLPDQWIVHFEHHGLSKANHDGKTVRLSG